MKTLQATLMLFGVVMMATAPVAAITVAEAQELLEEIDRALTLEDTDFSAVMTMITEDPEAGVEKRVVRQYRRDEEDKFLMLFEEPVTQRGQGYLRVDDTLWFYDPESRKFSHTSMKEQFGDSDANNSDFGAATLSEDYRVTLATEGSLGRFQVYIIDLKATHNEVTYPSMRVWVTSDSHLLLKSEDFSANNRLMRTSYFPNYARVGDEYIASTLIFVDNLVEGKKTQITLSDISTATLPDTLFTKAYIERVNR